MAQLAIKAVLKVQLCTVGEFATANGVSSTAVYAAIKANTVDHFTIGSKVFICNTNLTRQYKPNESPRRKKPVKAKKVKKHTRNNSGGWIDGFKASDLL